MLEKEVSDEKFYPYNETFHYYECGMPYDECVAFVNGKNELKGGHWVVRSRSEIVGNIRGEEDRGSLEVIC